MKLPTTSSARSPRAARRRARPRAALVGFGGDLHTFEHALPAALRAYAASVGAAAAAAAVGALVAPAPLLLAVIRSRSMRRAPSGSTPPLPRARPGDC